MKRVQSPGANPPFFVVPPGLDAIQLDRLEESKLIDFYEKNNDDFHAVVTLVYDIAAKAKDPGAVLAPQRGFKSFCELLTKYLMAAPSETVFWSKDEKGRHVNFFGKALMDHMRARAASIQELYAYDGPEKHEREWHFVYALVGFVAVDAFREGVRVDDDGIAEARKRISELTSGDRKLRYVVAPIFNR